MLISKWWIADVVDGTEGIMYGFPFIYKSPAFYTSMAEEYFLIELFADFLIYFVIIIGIVYIFNRFLFEIKNRKIISVILYIIAALLLILKLFLISISDSKFSLKRDFDIEIKQTGLEYPFNNKAFKEFQHYYY